MTDDVLDAGAVVGEEAYPQRGELPDGSEALAGPPHGDGPRHRHLAHRPRTQREHLERHRRAVDGRVGVGHGHHGREPPQGGRPGPALHGLGVLGAGLAEMGVQVHESGSHQAPPGVEHRRPRRHRHVGSDLDHLPRR